MRILLFTKLPKNEAEIKKFPEKQKLREFNANRSAFR